jgi:hypothetical protein
MLRILLFLGMTAMAVATVAYGQQTGPDDGKFVCKDSVDPRCMSE